MNERKYVTMFVVLIVLVAGGFFFVLDRMGTLSTEIENVKLQLDLSKTQVIPGPASTSTPIRESATSTPKNDGTLVKIPTAILFDAQSSPILSPQTTLSISIQDVERNPVDGTFVVTIKVFTNNASGYSAIDPKTILQVISFEGGNIEAVRVEGQFDSMPPKSATMGKLIFTTDPKNTNVILQVGKPENASFYEFNFSKKSYRETTVG